MNDISEHAITTVNHAEDCLRSFVSEVDMLITYNEVERALYEKRQVPEAAAFLINHGGDATFDIFGKTITHLQSEHEDRILHAHVTDASEGGAVVSLAEYKTTLFRKRRLAVQSAVLHVGAIGPQNKIVDSEQRTITLEEFKERNESTVLYARHYALTVKNLAELLLFITE